MPIRLTVGQGDRQGRKETASQDSRTTKYETSHNTCRSWLVVVLRWCLRSAGRSGLAKPSRYPLLLGLFRLVDIRLNSDHLAVLCAPGALAQVHAAEVAHLGSGGVNLSLQSGLAVLSYLFDLAF